METSVLSVARRMRERDTAISRGKPEDISGQIPIVHTEFRREAGSSAGVCITSLTLPKQGRNPMIRLIAVAFALALASSAQAMPPAPLQQADELIINVREACGAGMHRVN